MTWPLLNIINIWKLEQQRNRKQSSKMTTLKTTHWAAELIVRYLRLSTYLAVTLVSYVFTFPLEEAREHFSFDTSTLSWMMIILFRNLFLEVVLIGGWHWYLYERKSKVVASLKFNKTNQYESSKHNLKREQFYTTLGFLMSTVYEIIILRLWATKSPYIRPYYSDFWAHPMWSVFQLLLIGYWRDFHFYFVHRVMHPWRFQVFGKVDIGQWLYKHVHSLHHKSYNPGPWSGLSMHPFEHLLYYTCTLLNFIFVLHPIHFLFNKFHADLSPIAGHDGHDQPAGGSLFHYLHHAHFECNYGTPMVPLDVWFGTYVATEKEWCNLCDRSRSTRIMRRRKIVDVGSDS